MTRHNSRCLFSPLREGAAGLDLLQALAAAFDFGEDILGLGLPDERLGVTIPRCDECLDGANQVGDADKAATAHRLAGQIPEPAFDQIEPTGAGRNEMHLEARVPGQPTLDLRTFLGAV